MRVSNWGLVGYEQAVQRQMDLVEQVQQGGEEHIVLCTHPPVVTLGRGTKPGDVTTWQGPTIEVSRGGRATYHGPSQVLVYPILNLNFPRKTFAARDLHSYMRALEVLCVGLLRSLGIEQAESRTTESAGVSMTGVWVSEKKIASIGIAVRQWISYHGMAINWDYDAQAFSGIQPCGFKAETMTSVEQVLGRPVPRSKCEDYFLSMVMANFLTPEPLTASIIPTTRP